MNYLSPSDIIDEAVAAVRTSLEDTVDDIFSRTIADLDRRETNVAAAENYYRARAETGSSQSRVDHYEGRVGELDLVIGLIRKTNYLHPGFFPAEVETLLNERKDRNVALLDAARKEFDIITNKDK